MGNIDKHCQMCGAVPGDPCTYVSTLTPDHEMVRQGHDVAHNAGDPRPDTHWARHGTKRYAVLILDEPSYADA